MLELNLFIVNYLTLWQHGWLEFPIKNVNIFEMDIDRTKICKEGYSVRSKIFIYFFISGQINIMLFFRLFRSSIRRDIEFCSWSSGFAPIQNIRPNLYPVFGRILNSIYGRAVLFTFLLCLGVQIHFRRHHHYKCIFHPLWPGKFFFYR